MTQYSWIRTALTVLLISSIGACGGGGSSTTTVATPTVARTPLAVKKSSCENKIAAAEVVGSRALPREVNNGLAYADFFQEGEYSLVGHSLEYSFKDRSTSKKFGHIHFYKSLDGQWVDKTSDILGDTAGCLHVRKAVVADFNRAVTTTGWVTLTGTKTVGTDTVDKGIVPRGTDAPRKQIFVVTVTTSKSGRSVQDWGSVEPGSIHRPALTRC